MARLGAIMARPGAILGDLGAVLRRLVLGVEKGADVACRNRDGYIPRGTPRIFSTNWPWDLFWPREAQSPGHSRAIRRRILWVHVQADLRGQDNVAGAFNYFK